LLGAQISVRRTLYQLPNGEFTYREPKTAASKRTIDISPKLIDVLNQHQNGGKMNEPVFNKNRKPLRPNTVSRAWELACKNIDIKAISFHGARYTHATLLLKQGVNPKIVQERLGHSSIQITLDTYSHVMSGIQAAAALKFDELFVKK
jgi:integrase